MGLKAKILIVEDDADINQLIQAVMDKNNYQTVQAFSGTEAALRLDMEKIDLIILDLMLPGLTGEELLRSIRQDKRLKIPVLVLSAKNSLESKVELLLSGADDYLTKPFEPEELAARVYACLRRTQTETAIESETLVYQKLQLCLSSRTVTVNGVEINLTAHEYEILRILMKEPDKVFSREILYEQVWQGGYYGEDNTVNVHVSNLRRKIAAEDPDTEYIKTVWGIGFKMAKF